MAARAKQATFHTLYVSVEWTHRHCVVPDGFDKGQPFILGDEQLKFWADFYQIRPAARFSRMPAEAFVYRRGQLVRPQKWGKSPFLSAMICNEAVGPAVFAGWAVGGERWVCSGHGCGCGWVYKYEPGEAMAIPWPTPLIQVTAATEDQTENTYKALRPMIELGPLSELIPRTGEEFIRLPGGGYIDTVTSSSRGRLGQRLTFAPQDETGTYITPGLRDMASTQLRGAAAMGGRGVETTNTWNPSELSTGQQTYESPQRDILKDYRKPPAELKFTNKADRRKIFAFNYRGAPWVSVSTIEGLTAELIAKGRLAEAERYYGNRITAGDARYLDEGVFEARAVRHEMPPAGTRIALGFDGADTDDWTALRAETLDGYQFTPRYGPAQLPTRWNPADYRGQTPRLEVDAAVREMFATYKVVLMYGDPPYWQSELDAWAGEFGEQTVRRFETYRPVQMHAALERYATDIAASGRPLNHDGDPITTVHFLNARRAARPGGRYVLTKASDAQKIDDCMASVLAHEAVQDAIAGGAAADDSPTYGFAFA